MSGDSIVYFENLDRISSQDIEGFFVGWHNSPSASTLLSILRNSAHCVIAYDTNARKVVGFVNCISDGILSAYIPLLEVLPDYQHRGIGTKLIERMLELTSHYYMTDLSCDAAMAPFYEEFGMRVGTAMCRRNYHQQSGTQQ